MSQPKILIRFNEKWEPVTESGCWIWTGARNPRGYGKMCIGPRASVKYIDAHRLSYMLHIGEIPDGHVVMHTCDNPSCVNPAHLKLGTQKDNLADRDAKGRRSFRQRGRYGPGVKYATT